MSWEIFLGISALVGFVISIGKIISANTKALTQLQESIRHLNTTLGEQGSNIHTLDDKVHDHETRIVILERGEHK